MERGDVAPTAPFTIDPPTVKRLFGTAPRWMSCPSRRSASFCTSTRPATRSTRCRGRMMPAIRRAIRERRSTDISVMGHTDRTGITTGNYELGLRRAERVAGVLRAQGVDTGSMSVASHGEVDPLVKTRPGVAEQRNRRVEVIVH